MTSMLRLFVTLLTLALLSPVVAADDESTPHTTDDGSGTTSGSDSNNTTQTQGDSNETSSDGTGTSSGSDPEAAPADDGSADAGSDESRTEGGSSDGEDDRERESSSDDRGQGAGPVSTAVAWTVDKVPNVLPQPSGCKWYAWYSTQPSVQIDPVLGMIVLSPMDCIQRIIDGPTSAVHGYTNGW